MNNIDIEKYNDINYLSTLLFDVLYNKKMDRKVQIEDVSVKDAMKMSNIKKQYDGNELTSLINSVFNRNVSYQYNNLNKYIFKINDIDHPVDIILSPNPSNMNKMITYLLSGLVINKKTKHILMNIFNFDVPSDKIKYFITKISDDENIIKILTKKDQNISVELREHYFKMDTLQNIFNDVSYNIIDDDIYILIFQVLHTLAIIQERYPTFKHNNLDLKNIYCYLKEKNSSTYEYKLDGNTFIIPNIGLEIKITNFEEANILNEIDNESIIDSLKTNDNTYDIKTFLVSLNKVNKLSNEIKIFIKDIMNNLESPKELLFSSSKFNSMKSKSGMSEASFEDKIKRVSLLAMDSEISVDGPSMARSRRVKKSSKKGSKKTSRKMKGGAKKRGSKRGSKMRKQKRDTVDADEDTEEELSEVEDEDEEFDESEKPKKEHNKEHKKLLLDDMSSDVSVDEDEVPKPKEHAPVMKRASVQRNSKMGDFLGSDNSMNQSARSVKTNKLFGALGATHADLNTIPSNLPMIDPSVSRMSRMQGNMPMNMPGNLPIMTESPIMGESMMPMPSMMNQPMMNPQMMNPQMMNPQMMNPQMMNQPMMNQPMMNQPMMNPQMMNPQMMNPQMMMNPNMIGGNKDFFFDSVNDSKNSNDLKKASLKYKSKKQRGGFHVIPKYIEPFSNPYQPKEEAITKSKQYYDDNKKKIDGLKPDSMLEPKDQSALNGTTQAYIPPQQSMQGMNLQVTIPHIMPPGPTQKVQQTFNPTYYVPMMNPYMPNTGSNPLLWHPAVPPIVQKYNITFGGADVTRLGEIYEDMLPTRIAMAKNTFNSLSERLTVINYLRTVLIKQGDGEEIGFDSRKKAEINTLLSHLKIIGVNPYNFNKTNNPYTGLPDRLLVYKSCYPIKVDQNTNIQCSNDNIGINVRIYQLLEGESVMTNLGNEYKKYFEVWREMVYYEKIREEVIKNNVSPNFVSLISYFMHPRTLLDFAKYRKAKDSQADPSMTEYHKYYNKFILHKILNIANFRIKLKQKLEDKYSSIKPRFINGHVRDLPLDMYALNALATNTIDMGPTANIRNSFLSKTINMGPVVKIKKEKPYPQIVMSWDQFIDEKLIEESQFMNYSDTCLIALTEAPTQNIKTWSTRKYEQNGINVSILRMVSTGYHDPEVWKSIIFQLHSAFYILCKKGICIWNFNLENNVFIKDTNYDNNNIGFWKYIIQGISFYIPNYGSILLIDTQFKDLDVNSVDRQAMFAEFADCTDAEYHLRSEDKFRYKIMMKDVFDNSQELKNAIDTRNQELFTQKVFNGREFSLRTDIHAGLIPTDQPITDLVNNIGRLPNDIENIIKNHGHYLHNRVGTPLNESEKKNIIADKKDAFKSGSLIGYSDDGLNYSIAIFMSDVPAAAPAGAAPAGAAPAGAAPGPAAAAAAAAAAPAGAAPAAGAAAGAAAAAPGAAVPLINQARIIKIDRTNRIVMVDIINTEYANIVFINENIKQSYKPNYKLSSEELIETYEIKF